MTDVDTEIELLQNTFKKDVESINNAAFKHQEALRDELKWSTEKQQADINVCEIKLEREIERLKQGRSGQGTKVGPVMKLPMELLSYIFRYHVDGDQSPWGLVKVCKVWMKAAFATPHLWQHICITNGGISRASKWVFDGKKYSSIGNKQLCETVAQLQVTLQRSGAVPLEIHVQCSNAYMYGPSLQWVSPLLSILVLAPISERIGQFNLGDLPWSDAILPTDIQFGPFTWLTTIHFPRTIQPWTQLLLASIDSTSLRLRTVVLNAAVCQELTVFSFWSRLQRLELPEGAGPGHLNDLVEQLSNIESIPNCPYLWPNERTPISAWEHIREIGLSCEPNHLSRLRLPNVESFTFICTTSRVTITGDIPALSYPKLTTLVIHTQDLRWFSNLSTPLLTHLTLRWSSDYPLPPIDAPVCISANILSYLTSIKLQTPRADVLIIAVLENAPNLHTIEVIGHFKDEQFGLELLKRLDPSQQPLLCPELESLSLGNQSEPIYTLKKNALQLIKRVVASRKRAGVPLKECSVYWHKSRSSAENYVK